MARWLPPGVVAGDVIAAYEGRGAASYAASCVNLANPGTYDLIASTDGYTPTWATGTGWLFPGRGTTTPSPLFGPTIPNGGTCTVIIKYAPPVTRKDFAGDGYLFGVTGNSGAYPFLAVSALHGSPGTPGSPSESTWYNGDSVTTHGAALDTGGTIAISGRKCYIDGADLGYTLGAWTGSLPSDHRIAIGGLSTNVNGIVANTWLGCWVEYFYVYNKELTSDEIGDIIDSWTAPVADFSGTPRSGYSCFTVAFTNLSTNATSYLWDFGDGTTSTDTNPSHEYCGDGPWTVSLTATNETASDTETKVAYITTIQTTVVTHRGQAASYMMWLNLPTGEHIAAIPEFLAMRAVRTVNDVGAITLTIPAIFAWDVISGRRDLQLEIWRKTFDGHYSLLTDTVWLVRKMMMARVGGALQYTLSGVSLTELLSRRIVYAYTGEAETSKTGAADDIIKAIVRENMGALVDDSARGLSSYVGVAADLGAAPSVAKNFAYRNVLQVAQEISQTSTALGTPLYFDIEAASSTNWNFYTYTGQRGKDRSFLTGDNSLVISELTGALVDPTWEEDYTQEITYVYAGGNGNGTARIIGMAPSATSTEYGRQFASQFNRREAWADARNGYSTVAACEYEAENVLRAGRPRKVFTGRIIDTPQSIYSLHWNWGDRVTAVFDTLQVDCVINALDIDATRERETISAQLRSVD